MLSDLAWLSIGIAIASAIWVAIATARDPQKMGIMNVVWPVSALYFSLAAVWAYYRVGKAKTRVAMAAHDSTKHGNTNLESSRTPSPWQVAVGASHCGTGCMLADVICEFSIAAAAITILGSVLWAEYIIDISVAWIFGIVFQYFAIQPMRHLPRTQAIVAAIKADTLSILAFQVGMYAWMALTFFVLFPHPHLTAFDPRYWLMMQIAMICGFFTTYPVNRWLIRVGLKEAM